jgi:methylase of polypeptide subunit release factors
MVAKETALYEPKGALYARNNGYEAYEIIASNIANYMKPEASIYLEIGLGQEYKSNRNICLFRIYSS